MNKNRNEENKNIDDFWGFFQMNPKNILKKYHGGYCFESHGD